jgi:hypothetical protein
MSHLDADHPRYRSVDHREASFEGDEYSSNEFHDASGMGIDHVFKNMGLDSGLSSGLQRPGFSKKMAPDYDPMSQGEFGLITVAGESSARGHRCRLCTAT